MNGLIQALNAFRSGVERDSICPVFGFKPARANTENETTAGCMIESRGHLGQDWRMPVRVACHEHADFDPARLQGKAGQRGPCFEAWPGRFAEDREKMIEHPGSVIAGLIDGLPNRDKFLPGGVLRWCLYSKSNLTAHHSLVLEFAQKGNWPSPG